MGFPPVLGSSFNNSISRRAFEHSPTLPRLYLVIWLASTTPGHVAIDMRVFLVLRYEEYAYDGLYSMVLPWYGLGQLYVYLHIVQITCFRDDVATTNAITFYERLISYVKQEFVRFHRLICET